MSNQSEKTVREPVGSSDGLCRDSTLEERMVWGECPTCHAKHGEPCNPDVGLHLGQKIGGGRMDRGEGVHLSRIGSAPMRVKLVAA